MIYTRMAGGLGNQLFQLAATLALRGEASEPVLVSTDGLHRYQVKRDFDVAHLMRLPTGFHAHVPSGIGGKWQASLMRSRIGRWLPVYGVNDRNFESQLLRRTNAIHPRTLWLDGYFQRHWPPFIFDAVSAQMQSLLHSHLPTPQHEYADCVMHIRGGDFLKSAAHQVSDGRYYLAAVAAMRQRRPMTAAVTVVTDDAAHARSIMDIVQQAQPDLLLSLALTSQATANAGWLLDFELLRNAPSRIIGNSTFAWWAAALDAQGAPTLSPSQWTRGVPRDLTLQWEQLIPV